MKKPEIEREEILNEHIYEIKNIHETSDPWEIMATWDYIGKISKEYMDMLK